MCIYLVSRERDRRRDVAASLGKRFFNRRKHEGKRIGIATKVVGQGPNVAFVVTSHLANLGSRRVQPCRAPLLRPATGPIRRNSAVDLPGAPTRGQLRRDRAGAARPGATKFAPAGDLLVSDVVLNSLVVLLVAIVVLLLMIYVASRRYLKRLINEMRLTSEHLDEVMAQYQRKSAPPINHGARRSQ